MSVLRQLQKQRPAIFSLKQLQYNMPVRHTLNHPYFSSYKSDYSLKFAIGQTSQEVDVLEAIQKFFLALPAKHYVERNNTNLVSLGTYSPAKGRNHKNMAQLVISQRHFITNVIVPFFDGLT